ncbi:MAG: hypothetical protein ACYCV7_11535 [Acidimicrobiales bacterium]
MMWLTVVTDRYNQRIEEAIIDLSDARHALGRARATHYAEVANKVFGDNNKAQHVGDILEAHYLSIPNWFRVVGHQGYLHPRDPISNLQAQRLQGAGEQVQLISKNRHRLLNFP